MTIVIILIDSVKKKHLKSVKLIFERTILTYKTTKRSNELLIYDDSILQLWRIFPPNKLVFPWQIFSISSEVHYSFSQLESYPCDKLFHIFVLFPDFFTMKFSFKLQFPMRGSCTILHLSCFYFFRGFPPFLILIKTIWSKVLPKAP